ncbi:(2Fe-2S)-binding protein [Herbidospora mongoliensis]|uniref:(2Fe-2S)-binding protein n=1 Tax=Herbidospora mongoliensis TaxID=688067 RepID=UPI0008358557|nr:(2Fe-2S)-binding protein [Herbidospora mongoliensis]
MTTIETAVADIAAINAFFAIGVGGGVPLVERLHDDAVIDETAKRLLTQDRRAAASILFQGAMARLWSPYVALRAAYGISIDLSDARWSDDGVRVPSLREGPRFALEPLVAALPWVSPLVLYGNAASALVGAVGAFSRARPGDASRADSLQRELLAEGPLAGRLDRRGVRRSCCLYYRVGGICGDCVLLAVR